MYSRPYPNLSRSVRARQDNASPTPPRRTTSQRAGQGQASASNQPPREVEVSDTNANSTAPPSPVTSSGSGSSRSSGSGHIVNRIITGGEERRNFLRDRYWRFREWARHSALNVPVEQSEEEEDENPFPRRPVVRMGRSAQQQRATQQAEAAAAAKAKEEEEKYKLPEPSPDDPPGFRWVYIEIV